MLASANEICWPVQQETEEQLTRFLAEKYNLRVRRTHPYREELQHGFIHGQRYGADVFKDIDPDAPLIVLLTAWQYSHHIATSLYHHRAPILILANFSGTYPGLVGALNLEGSLTGLDVPYARLWSENFDDDFFYDKFDEWIRTGAIRHDLSYLQPAGDDHASLDTPGGRLGTQLGDYVLNHKEIMGLFDSYCMGMMNGVFPQKSITAIGMPLESLSQSALLYEMEKVPEDLREACLQFYLDRGMDFRFGDDPENDLSPEQVKEQCAMMIAAARIAERFGCTSVGIQYQKGLKDCCAASDFAEGALNSTERFPIPDEDGNIIREGEPIPCINEVDMGSGIPQTMLFRILRTLGLPSETTLHDVRWGSDYEGTFYWDFEISGSVPFEHLKNGIAGAIGHRQAKMYFPFGGSTISGQGKKGRFVWARAFYRNLDVHLHIGSGEAFELPEEEFQRRLQGTTPVWPLMNCTLDGITRDDLMAGHQSNHITVAYVPEEHLQTVLHAMTAMAKRLGMVTWLAGQ
ncbi:MAG: signal transduction protein [Verrucomicrobiota bacterium]